MGDAKRLILEMASKMRSDQPGPDLNFLAFAQQLVVELRLARRSSNGLIEKVVDGGSSLHLVAVV